MKTVKTILGYTCLFFAALSGLAALVYGVWLSLAILGAFAAHLIVIGFLTLDSVWAGFVAFVLLEDQG